MDWQSAPASPSSLTVKRILRLEIPVDTYPNVCSVEVQMFFVCWSYASRFVRPVRTQTYILILEVSALCGCQFNFVGRLLGPRGNSLKRVEVTTGCRVYIRGKGSVKDPDKVL